MNKLTMLLAALAAAYAAFKYRLFSDFAPQLDDKLKELAAKLGFEKYAPVIRTEFDWDTAYFDREQFASPDAPGTWANMSAKLMQKLQDLANAQGTFPRVGSGFRTIAHNKKIGGVSNSAHTLGLACDLSFDSYNDARKWFELLCKAGFKRLGFYAVNTRSDGYFIHCDIDDTERGKPAALWFSDRYLQGHSTYAPVSEQHKKEIREIYNNA